MPAAQAAHCAGAVGVAGAVCSWPAGHADTGRQLAWFADDVYVPSAHAEHWRSLDAVPGVLTNVLATQSRQGAQLPAFDVVLKVALVHAAQRRSTVGEPAVSTLSPAKHVDHATQAVAAFASSSHVPAAHGALGAAPPGQ